MPNPPRNTDPEKNSPKKFRENLFGEEQKGGSKEEKDPTKQKTSLKNHDNWFVRSSARFGYTVWIVVMAVGLLLAFGVSLFLL